MNNDSDKYSPEEKVKVTGPQEIPTDITDEIKTSYLNYAMSVIVGRAIPEVRDGLKPVHRRVLYSMYKLGNTSDKPYKKSARIVGDTLLDLQQPGLLRSAMEKLPAGAVVLLAFDNDDPGEKLADEVRAIAPAGRELRRVLPDAESGKDWNDMLKRRLGLT